MIQILLAYENFGVSKTEKRKKKHFELSSKIQQLHNEIGTTKILSGILVDHLIQ